MTRQSEDERRAGGALAEATDSGSSVRPADAGRRGVLDRSGRRWLRAHPLGLLTGAVFAMLAMTPSLLPRDWIFQGLVSGITGAAGYGLGILTAWLVRRSRRWRRLESRMLRRWPERATGVAWAVLVAGVPAALATMLVVSAEWQREIDAIVGTEPTDTDVWLRAGPLLLLVAASLVALVRGVRWLSRAATHVLHRWVRLPRRLAQVVGLVVVAALLAVLVNDVLFRRALSLADASFSAANQGDDAGARRPVSSLRSGGPASLVSWEDLGRYGRRFVAGGPSPSRLDEVGSGSILPPIRVYIGLDSAPGPREQAELAMAELERTGAFDRAVVVVVVTTGSGWINGTAVDALEHMYRGDTAAVATQYSYLPSWLSFLLDSTRAEEAGRLLVDAVHARVDGMPEDDRPRLLVYGESLGSRGSEAAFSSLADIRARVDGVLWTGPPHSNELWRALVERRDPGSREVAPVYSSGLVVRFAGVEADLARPATPWLEPRVLYLQNPSDPIVWWSPDLLFRRPDWLVERRGEGVSPAMGWYPIITFWQVTLDMTNAKSPPNGHGHNYDNLIPAGWAAVAAPEGWTEEDTDRLRRVLGP